MIHQVEERHPGLNVCFATKIAGGLNYQTAHLEVVPAEDQVEEQGQEKKQVAPVFNRPTSSLQHYIQKLPGS